MSKHDKGSQCAGLFWCPKPAPHPTYWVNHDDGHAGGYPHLCTEYVGRHRLRRNWMFMHRFYPDGTLMFAFKVNLDGGAFK